MKIAKMGICSHSDEVKNGFGIMPWNALLMHVKCGDVIKGLKHWYSNVENFRFCACFLAIWTGFHVIECLNGKL